MPDIDFLSLFTRIGQLGNLGYRIAGSQVQLPDAYTDLMRLYEDTDDSDLLGGFISGQTGFVAGLTTPMSQITGLSGNTLGREVRNSSPPMSRSLSSALTELIRQMKANTKTVKACTVGATSAALSTNIGDGVVVLTTKRGDGLQQENIIAEDLRLACSADSYTGGATAGQESFQIAGTNPTSPLWNYDWPNGSGTLRPSTAISADEDGNSTSNLLTNGSFESWTDDAIPELTDWQLSGGVWGTDLQRSTDSYQGDYAVEFIAGTAANPILYEVFGTDTSPTPTSLTSYIVNLFIKRAGVVSAGVLTIELVDGSGTVINDQQGVANSTTITLSGITTSYVAHNIDFRIPEVPPAEMRFRLRMSTALAGANVLIDSNCFGAVTAAYTGGFGFAVFSGATPFVKNDGWSITSTNNRGGSLYGGTFQTLFNRLFGTQGLNMLLPTSATPTFPDSMITFPGIVGYYRFQNSLTDSSGNANTLSDSSATYGAGIIGQGLTGGAGTRSSAFSGLTGLAIGQPVSISHWVNVPALSTGAKTGTRVGWTTDTWYMQTEAADSSVGYGISVPGRAAVDGELPVSAWAHIVWTWDGVDAFQLYLNGVLLDDGTYTPTTANYNGAFTASADVATMGTDLDELLIANRVLTAAEVYQLYANGDANDPTNT